MLTFWEFSASNSCYSISHQQETNRCHMSNSMIMWDRWFGFRESRIPTVPFSYCKYYNDIVITLGYIHSLWSIIWLTANNHCDWSWGDCTMSMSTLSQVSNICPASVFVFGNFGCVPWWTMCIATDDQNAFTRWCSSIVWYSEIRLIYSFFVIF